MRDGFRFQSEIYHRSDTFPIIGRKKVVPGLIPAAQLPIDEAIKLDREVFLSAFGDCVLEAYKELDKHYKPRDRAERMEAQIARMEEIQV